MANLVSVKTLDMVNGEITKVAYGGVEYERVEGEAQKGDLVLIKDGWSFATQGKFYKSVGIDEGGDAKIIDNYGDIISNDRTTYDLFRKLSASTDTSVEERVAKAEDEIESLKSEVATLKGAAEPKPERLKVGDYAKVVKRIRDHSAEIGEIVLVKMDDKSVMPYKCDKLNGERVGWFYADELVRATDEEVTEAKRVAAEAVERKKWAEIGREVGEYKVGDIFRSPGGNLFEITRIDDSCAFPIIFTNLQGDYDGYKRDAAITLVTPVGARFDR
ncbi:hypothetical protein P9E08_08800 [Bacillus mojavensis]|uniref:hypothetical protein n=1 Tax=Bacillus mojavensis TaxID=72360 RepID=UPI002DB56379|nr:hypothetical protein [Bacillus mojavensis]MEC1625477.1 hypothetical protein [Bacillus mojavensis]